MSFQSIFRIKIRIIASPEVWQVWTGENHIPLFESLHMISDKPGSTALQNCEKLVFRMKMPIHIKALSNQFSDYKCLALRNSRFLKWLLH